MDNPEVLKRISPTSARRPITASHGGEARRASALARFAVPARAALLLILSAACAQRSAPPRAALPSSDHLKAAPVAAHTEAQVRQVVEAFYAAFNTHAFDGASGFTADDWNHVNPFGGRTRSREAVLRELRAVHGTFLKDVTDTIEEIDVRLATPDVAVAMVTSLVSPFTTPDGVLHGNERQIRTFVLVKRGSRWRIMHDHNTIVKP